MNALEETLKVLNSQIDRKYGVNNLWVKTGRIGKHEEPDGLDG